MKYPLFSAMENDYPFFLEEHFGRILVKIVDLWDTPLIHDYFSDLLIDKRGGRQGFPAEAVKELVMLREFHELETFRAAERKEDALIQLEERHIPFTDAGFLKVFREGNQEEVDLFVRANFTIPGDDDGTPILLAALKRGHTVVAKIVLGAGADVNARDNVGLTPLLFACGKTTKGYRTIAEGLIAKGANVNIRHRFGFTPLLLALSGGMFDIARLLIEHGADVRAVSARVRQRSILHAPARLRKPLPSPTLSRSNSKRNRPGGNQRLTCCHQRYPGHGVPPRIPSRAGGTTRRVPPPPFRTRDSWRIRP